MINRREAAYCESKDFIVSNAITRDCTAFLRLFFLSPVNDSHNLHSQINGTFSFYKKKKCYDDSPKVTQL